MYHSESGFLNKINDNIEIKNYDAPEPEDDEVTVEQAYSGVCFRDILTKQGFFPRVALPIIPGHEIGGTIVKKGKNVKSFSIGDKVSSLIYVPCGKCEFCLTGRENLCPNKKSFGETLNGGYSKYVNVNTSSLVKVPPGVPEEAIPIAACVTAMLVHAIVKMGRIERGDNVLITGAGGGVGVHAIQIVKAYGGHPIAETSSQWKEEELYKLGADHIVHASDDFNADVKKLGGADIVLEDVGIRTFNKSLRSLKTGGRMIVIGNLNPEPVSLPLGLIILKGNTIKGSITSTREDLKIALDLNASGKVKPIIGRKINISEINRAYDAMLAREIFGRVLVEY